MNNRNAVSMGGTIAALALSLAPIPAGAADDNPFQTREVKQPSSQRRSSDSPIQRVPSASRTGTR